MPGRPSWGEDPVTRRSEVGMGAFWLHVQISAEIRGGKGLGIRCACIAHRVVLALLRITWILSKGKKSSKGEVKTGTTAFLKKDGKAIKVFPGC